LVSIKSGAFLDQQEYYLLTMDLLYEVRIGIVPREWNFKED
jgi:hypothetical protein